MRSKSKPHGKHKRLGARSGILRKRVHRGMGKLRRTNREAREFVAVHHRRLAQFRARKMGQKRIQKARRNRRGKNGTGSRHPESLRVSCKTRSRIGKPHKNYPHRKRYFLLRDAAKASANAPNIAAQTEGSGTAAYPYSEKCDTTKERYSPS